jgi:hypothetical protein
MRMRHLHLLCYVFILPHAVSAGDIHIFCSHTGPGEGSPPELVPGQPAYQTNPVFLPGEPIYVWAQASPNELIDAIGVDLRTNGAALMNGPLGVANPLIVPAPAYPIGRWNGYLVGTPMPPALSHVINVKMVAVPVPIPPAVIFFGGVSNPVNKFDAFDGYNDPATQSAVVFGFYADGGDGSGYFRINSLLTVTLSPPDPVYFGWGDPPVDGGTTGSESLLPDWFVSRNPDLDGIDYLIDNCPGIANSDQSDTDRDGMGDVCDPCPGSGSGDMNGDLVINELDLDGFVTKLLDPTARGPFDPCTANVDGSAAVDGRDIPLFMHLMAGN